MAQASPSANLKLDRNESQSMLRRGVAPADATDGAPQKSDFPLSSGKPKSTRLRLGLKDRLIFWILLAVLHAFILLPDFILYPLGIACGLLFHPSDHRHPKILIPPPYTPSPE